ncbi:MAG: ubiquinol-cytochrome c reductase iron-sulfur subunit [Alphaproteobacteria bacterium]|nr:ubiquinol-cytochrome c reductase iron-sulfur subunit [Alphaproteobacteria bacterium]
MADSTDQLGETRRDFILLAGTAMAGVGAAVAAWPLIHSMNPSADVLALASTEVDLSPVQEGQAITVVWRGKPVFIRHRTATEIEAARAVDTGTLRDPQTDAERVESSKFGDEALPQWLVMVGVCTHLGCIPLGQKPTDDKGEFNGWFCPCHGSAYDTAGRIRKGPAPKNLAIPPYTFTDASRIRIG